MAAGGNPLNVDLGPGRLYFAPVGTTEPTNCSTAMPSAWNALGYTEDGTSIDFEITSEAVEVAEEVAPIGFEQTRRTTQLSVTMAEATKKRLTLALGGGASGTDDSTVFNPPTPGSVVPVMLVWDAMDTTDATNRRWVFRQCTPSGTVNIARRKAPQKALIAVTFDCAKPTSALEPFSVFPNSSGQI